MAGTTTDNVEHNADTNNIEKTREEPGNEITPECLVKHPLQNQWTLWYLENDRNKSWEDMQNEITSFDTVEDFWSLYNHIRVASELKQGNDYSLFKKNIRPMWEDAANKRGGRWVLNLNKQQRRNELDALWLDILLCLIGESFEYSDDINGAVVNIRPRGDKISIWTADGTNQDSILSIGHKLKECLRLPNEVQISYELHKDTANKQGQKMAFTI